MRRQSSRLCPVTKVKKKSKHRCRTRNIIPLLALPESGGTIASYAPSLRLMRVDRTTEPIGRPYHLISNGRTVTMVQKHTDIATPRYEESDASDVEDDEEVSEEDEEAEPAEGIAILTSLQKSSAKP